MKDFEYYFFKHFVPHLGTIRYGSIENLAIAKADIDTGFVQEMNQINFSFEYKDRSVDVAAEKQLDLILRRRELFYKLGLKV